MNYSTVQPPFTLVFREMSKKELHDYNEWFHRMMPERVAVVTSAIKSTPGYETWEPNCSPESLEPLGEWFSAQVEIRPRTRDEVDAIQNRSKFPINIPGEELTNKTLSLAMDIGMYLSEVFLKKHPALEWSQPLSNKKVVDYGQPVLIGFGAAPFNPVRMIVTLAYGLANQAKTGKSLREIYNIWSNLASAVVK